VLESDQPGLVYDSLAINGARASVLARYDEAHWKAEMARREPSLVILMFGANEGHNESLPLKEYRVHLAEVIRTLRAGVPDASLLVVGPLDQAKRKADGSLDSRRMPARLTRSGTMPCSTNPIALTFAMSRSPRVVSLREHGARAGVKAVSQRCEEHVKLPRKSTRRKG